MPFAGHAKPARRVDVTGQLGGGRITGEHDTLFDRRLEPMFGERGGLDALAEIIRPREFRERGRYLPISAGIADIGRQAAVRIVAQEFQVMRNLAEIPLASRFVIRVHPTLVFHLAPEGVFFERGEIADDFERTCMDASLPRARPRWWWSTRKWRPL
jgi:hypothetical protein